MKWLRTLMVSAALCMSAAAAFAADVSYPSVLGGTVVSITPAGTAVKQGDVLLTVDFLAGPMPAARAASDGVVKQVLVAPGTAVKRGTAVIIVEEK